MKQNRVGDGIITNSEWIFYYHKSGVLIAEKPFLVLGPFDNYITAQGLSQVAAGIEALPSPYLVVGNDTVGGETITEVFRKAVSSVTRSGNVTRFRTTLQSNECNGDHKKTCIFFGASAATGSGTMFNLLQQAWNKTSDAIVTVEARITATSA